MKYLFAFFLILFFSATNLSNAKVLSPDKISIHLGLESVQGKANGNSSLKSEVTGHYGVGLEFQVYEASYLKTGLYIGEKSHYWNDTIISGSHGATYLEIPLGYAYRFSESFSLFGGARLEKKLHDKGSCQLNGTSCPGSEFESFIYGAEAGGTYQPLKHLLFEASYFYGLSKLTKDSDLKNGFIMSVAYVF